MDEKLPSITGLLRKDNGYYFQARIPKDCLAHYPRPIFREKLQAPDLKTAKALVAQRWTILHEEFSRIRATGSRAKTVISPRDAQEIIGKALQRRLQADEELRSLGLDDDAYNLMSEMHEEADLSERLLIARGKLDGRATSIIAEWLSIYDYEIEEGSPEFLRFARDFLKAQMSVTKAFKQRHQGEPVENHEVMASVPILQGKQTASQKSPMLSEVVDYFMEHYDKSRPMYAKHKTTLPLFMEFVGNKPVDQVRQMDVEGFARMVCKLPPRWDNHAKKLGVTPAALANLDHEVTLSPKTFVHTYAASLKVFLAESKRSYGDAGFPSSLTTEGLKYRGDRKEGQKKQRAFTAQELKRLFEGEEMRRFAEVPQDHPKYWLPLIGLYTGARVNEICQLNPQTDIRQEEEIWIFDFTEQGEGDDRIRRSVKNRTSERKVPVHPSLIAVGFLSYITTVKESGSKLLFPDWPPITGRAGASAERWFREFLEKISLRDETPSKTIVGMHAFRHTFLNRAFNLGVKDAEILTGHATQKSVVVRGYEGSLSLKNKLRIIEKIAYDLELPLVNTIS